MNSFYLLITALALSLATPALAADKGGKDSGKRTCCQTAAAEGKECPHRCCVAAHQAGKSCVKCNPGKEDLAAKSKKK